MSGLILTTPNSKGNGNGNTSTETTVLPLTTQVADSGIFSDSPAAHWMVTIYNPTTGDTSTMIIQALHDFLGTVIFNCSSILGDVAESIVSVVAGGADEMILQGNRSVYNGFVQ